MECASADHAVREATIAASQMSADLNQGDSLSVIVRDEQGEVATVTVELRVLLHRRE